MLTMKDALVRAERDFADRIAVAGPTGDFTWAEHIARVRRCAGFLLAQGLVPGDRFAILGLNSHRYNELLHAGYWAGLIPVPINHRLAPPEIRQIVDDADCKLLVHSDAHTRILDAPELAGVKARALNLQGRYEDLLVRSPVALPHDSRAEDLALLLFTGGTTGRSKGVCLSHGNIVANGEQVAAAMRATAEDRYLHVAPMFHAADLLATAFTLVGGSHAYLPSFSGEGVLKAIQDFGATVCMMAPAMIVMTLQVPNFAAYDLTRFRLLFYGSSPMDAVWVRRAMESFAGVDLQQGYGLTETSPILTTLDPSDHREAVEQGNDALLRAAGRAVAGVDLRIRDDDGKDVRVGTVGEVVVRGPNVATGYFNRPEETQRAFRDGWFYTGDVGRLDEDEILYLVDRKKDVVITGGENVYTTEVEAALYQHPHIQEVAVIGVPDKKYGEALLAVVVPVAGQDLSIQDVIEHCRGRIGSYKIPRRMEIVSELPKSAMGKILKAELRRLYAGRTTKF